MKYTAFYKRSITLAALILYTCMPLDGTAAYEKLQKGDSGEAVFKLEEAMAMQGYFDAMPDQIYDDATVYGVKAFQEAHNLKVDGIAGAETLTLLYSAFSANSGETAGTSELMPSTLRNLSLNKQGDDVSSLQSRLTELGYYTGRISGSYGKLTKSAVETFQKANGLTADGIAGIRTQTKLYSATAISAASASLGAATDTTANATTSNSAAVETGVIYETLKAGMNNEGVRQMQQRLKELGYYSGTVSGNFGNVTWEAVKAFQKAVGLTADGIAGQKTLEKLYSTSAPSTGKTDTTTTNTTTDTNTAIDTSKADTTLTLKVGTNSDAVKQMQQKLKELGYYTGSVTGRFGNLTWEGVRKFQKAKGLTADGIAGPKTLEALYAASNGSANANTSANTNTNTSASVDEVTVNATLRVGSRGTDVKTMQKRLKELGYLSGSADGIFGTGTESAVKAFQTANALYADGVAGPKTLNRLNSSSAVAATGGSSASFSTGKNDTSTTLRHGMKDMSQIRDMQTRLTELGYYSGSITGNFGDLTLKAVKAFQTNNNLSADGIAGKNTLTKLYSSGALKAGSTSSSGSSFANLSGWPKASEVKNVDWYDYIRPYYKAGTVMQIYDFENNLTWQCVMMSNGKHSDSQPRTAEDTEIMYKAFGNKNTWTPKAVWIRMPDGKVFLASMHNMPHLSGSIKNNNFDGHLCIHFPRTMSDAEATGPYAVSHQKEIIKGWEKTQKLAGN